jgi:hypothetical protein
MVHKSKTFIYAKSKNDGKEGLLIQQSGLLVILVCTKRYGTLTILILYTDAQLTA